MNHLWHRFSEVTNYFLWPADHKDRPGGVKFAIVVAAILGVWLTAVIFATTAHEFWRDEIRAWSLARAATSPSDLYALLQDEGHPVLWYLLLYIGKSIVDTPVVLPITSIIIAFAAVVVFMLCSPFPFWIRCLFIFCALPFYEYSVMARNYGLSMLLLFVAAVLYRNRAKHPYLLAAVLALLANSNVHSVILASLIAALWAWDIVVDRRTAYPQSRALPHYLPLAVVLAGVLLCAAFTWPSESTVVTSVHSKGIRELAIASFDATIRPQQTFSRILPEALPTPMAWGVLYLAVFGLVHRPNLLLAALGGQIAFGVFFRVVYHGGYRHQGLFLIFMLFLYWLLIESPKFGAMTRSKRLVFNMGLYVAMPILILANVVKLSDTMWPDIRSEWSSSRAFGEFLNSSHRYRDAIIVPEPDYFAEALPYYAKNSIYFPREHRFGTTVSFTKKSTYRLSLGELLSAAREIKTRYGKPVLIMFAHRDLDNHSTGERKFSYRSLFSWNANESAAFTESTILVRDFNSAYSDENYRVYAVR